MAYVDRQSGTSRAASIATVGVIHAALGAALIYGLAATFVPREEDTPLPVTEFPVPKTTPPPEQPTDSSTPTDSTVTAADPTIKVNTIGPEIAVAPIPEVVPPFVPPALPTYTPPPEPQLFKPKSPRVANDQSTWVTTDHYPSSDLRLEHTGTTKYRVVIGTNGRVSSCEVVNSSGWPGLDKAACAKVKSNARFEPATDSSGAKAVGTYSGSVIWRIPQ